MVRRLTLAFLLILVLFGLAGHLFAPSSQAHHASLEAHCALHSGLIASAFPIFSNNFTSIFSIPDQHIDAARFVASKIPHPPTI